MKRKLAALFLVVFVLQCFAVTAYAESFSGSDGMAVTFDGKNLTTNFGEGDIDQPTSAIQPGDDITFTVAVQNRSETDTAFYMTNEVLNSFLQSDDAGGAYAYRLVYNSAADQRVIYDSDTVGGDDTAGLMEINNAYDGEWFYLGNLAANEDGAISLTITLDGETNGNSYQETMAALEMTFAAEPLASPSAPPGSGTPIPSPHTGDSSHLGLWAVIMAISAAACVALVVVGKKNRREDGAQND